MKIVSFGALLIQPISIQHGKSHVQWQKMDKRFNEPSTTATVWALWHMDKEGEIVLGAPCAAWDI